MIPPPLWAGAVGEIKLHYVYLLRSVESGQLYLGWTTDLQRRLNEHNNGDSLATRNRGPYELIYFEAYRFREEAVAREQSLKKHPNVIKQLKARLYRSLATASSVPKEVVG